jgi:hypothetical protein
MSSNWVEEEKVPGTARRITVIRDPYDRFCSAFFFLNCRTPIEHGTNKMIIGHNRGVDFGHPALVKLLKRKMENKPVDEELVRLWIDSIKACGFWNDHLAPQHAYLDGEVDFAQVNMRDFKTRRRLNDIDVFMHTKRLSADLKRVFGIEGAKIRNKNESRPPNAIEFVRPFRDEIRSIYERDFEIWEEHGDVGSIL